MTTPLRSAYGSGQHPSGTAAAAVPTLLVAEDDETVRQTLIRVLTHHGYRVQAVRDGEAAWAILADRHAAVDLVICDLIMPRLGGRALLQMARRLNDSPSFLVISGWAPQLGDERPGGIDDHLFLPKPWTTDELLDAVKAALGS